MLIICVIILLASSAAFYLTQPPPPQVPTLRTLTATERVSIYAAAIRHLAANPIEPVDDPKLYIIRAEGSQLVMTQLRDELGLENSDAGLNIIHPESADAPRFDFDISDVERLNANTVKLKYSASYHSEFAGGWLYLAYRSGVWTVEKNKIGKIS